ncbi:hypothetical protein N7468_002521 [Penicillium chermesinum]|uniref:Nucleoporin n=1 Tax=Penicillium chermesinum TaxID=63820 RepID=A0A9W9TYI9_9EURO|nr:uncharacterized protein N7468_002521 [Penicillium chermesinum]KAJ5247538.1 hypothetical protein N7468_002521 [Penicillium chermesinum]
MAPVPEAYFPSLDKCFSGDAQLLAWERAFLHLSDPNTRLADEDNVSAFLSHPDSVQLLSQSLTPFTPPSPKTKSDFDSKTSAIHVETNSKSSFDLKEIKADAQWLSEKAKIDEITALRIIVLEWQSRPAIRLAKGFSNEEATSIQSATGSDNLGMSVAGPNLASILKRTGEDNGDLFDSETSRRLRIREIYISERTHVLKTYRKLLALSLHNTPNPVANESSTKVESKPALRKLGVTLFADKSTGNALSEFLKECISAISTRLNDFAQEDGWLGAAESNSEIELNWKKSLTEEVLHIMQLMFHQLHTSAEVPSADLLLSWLELMDQHNFLQSYQVQGHVAVPATFSWGLVLHTIRELATNDAETREMEQLDKALDSFQSNTPNRRSSRTSEPTLYEDLYDSFKDPNFPVEDVIFTLTNDDMSAWTFEMITSISTGAIATSAVDDALTYQFIRLALLNLIRVSVTFFDYSPELMEAVLAILNGKPGGSFLDLTGLLGPDKDPKSVFIEDAALMRNIFDVARARFPYETVPFLRLCRALMGGHSMNEEGLPLVFDLLENMETFTQVVPESFQGYKTTREDENANFVSLVQSLRMFDSVSRDRLPGAEASNALVLRASSEIPTSTLGQVISQSKPAVIMWQYQYSCLNFLGSWLEEWNENGGFFSSCDSESATEVIDLLADLVFHAQDRGSMDSVGVSAKRVLEMASDGLSRKGDIITVVLDIFERNLQDIVSQRDPSKALDPIMACLRFIQAILKVLPCRVWPFFSRSSFIGSDGKGGLMTAIISATEIPSGQYPFLLSCVDLFKAVVDDAASRAVLRRCPGSVSSRSQIATDWSASVPSHVMRSTILNLTRTMVDIFNSSGNWRFDLPEQRFQINASLAAIFERIIYCAYGINEETKLDSKITGVFSTSAVYLLDMLRPRSTADLPFNPLLRLISEGLYTPSTSLLRYLNLVENQVSSTLKLCVKLVQAAVLAELSGTILEEQLFKAAPILVKLYASHDAYRLPVTSLLDVLISRAASSSDNEPPSLVGHLGADSACLFLDVLSQLDKPLNDKTLHLSIWRLLSTFVSKRQQWLAVFILTGASPRQTLKKSDRSKDPSMRGMPFLQIALDRLAHIDQEEPQVALALLDFVSQAQENWPWATPQLKSHPQFLTAIIHYVSKLKISALPVTEQIFITRIAAMVADICAVYLHAAKEARDESFVKTLIPLVQWYAKDAVNVSGYNSSLHANLKKNFENRYTGCKIIDFKRTALENRTLGNGYFYDLAMGQQMLSYDFAWAGKRGQGFAEEFERANINLSLVEAQVSLLNSWKYFAIEHSADFMPHAEIQKSMAIVAQDCLEANSRGVPSEAIFSRIQQVRVDFAQALIQRLVQVGARGNEAFGLLEVAWKAIRARHSSFELALINDDTEYYRSLLNVLFLALQFHLGDSRGTDPAAKSKGAVSSDLMIAVEVAFCMNSPEKCTPKDFAIIIAILQMALQVKDIERLYEHITYHIAENSVSRHATTLFSWADQLTVNGDPVYGDLSLSILVKMSTIPTLADHLAAEGALMQLSTCRLTNILRQPKGFGPFDPVPRLYTIWTTGVLPLCLNLLYNVIRATPEVAAFLNQFEGQLTRAAEVFSLGHPGTSIGPPSKWISLSMASEAYSLSLISFIIQRAREAGPGTGLDPQSIQELKWDQSQVKEDLEELLNRRPSLRARITATNEKEVEWARQKPVNAKLGAENRLEEKVVGELQAALTCLTGEEES